MVLTQGRRSAWPTTACFAIDLRSVINGLSVFLVVRTYLLATACFTQLAAAQQNNREVRAFLPPAAVVKQELSVDFEGDGRAEPVLVYSAPDRSHDAAYYDAGIQVLKYSPGFGWAVASEEPEARLIKGEDEVRGEKLRSASGEEGVLVINYHSGAGTVTTWYVLACVREKITMLDPTLIRKKLLSARDYADNGYNSVKSKGDLVVEELTGYSRHAARCCPNRPSLEMNFKFTGNGITVDSVKELPYGVPKSGSHGPLLHLSVAGLWAYGYQLADGFLVLGGSESPKENAPSAPAAIVAIRNDLLRQGVLGDAGEYLMFMGDYRFKSPSVAADVVRAGPAKGRMGWTDENGRTESTP